MGDGPKSRTELMGGHYLVLTREEGADTLVLAGGVGVQVRLRVDKEGVH